MLPTGHVVVNGVRPSGVQQVLQVVGHGVVSSRSGGWVLPMTLRLVLRWARGEAWRVVLSAVPGVVVARIETKAGHDVPQLGV